MAQGNNTIGLSPDQAAAAAAFDFQLYHYDPSLPAAVVAVAVFAILTALHILKILRHRSLYFTPFVVGGLCTSPIPGPVIHVCARSWASHMLSSPLP